MKRKPPTSRQDDESSVDRIIAATIELLDKHGEQSFTLRALASRLDTGLGAIYWHVENRQAIIDRATDSLIAECIESMQNNPERPADYLRNLALALYNTMDRHPWLGSSITVHVVRQPHSVLILDRIGVHLHYCGVSQEQQFYVASAFLHYIIGVGAQMSRTRLQVEPGTSRDQYLEAMRSRFEQLDTANYPFMHANLSYLRSHDDKEQFMTGIDLMLRGLEK